MSETKAEICPICRVQIVGDRVIFSCGPEGDRDTLWKRVCQHARDKSRCLNRGKDPAILRLLPNRNNT